MVKYVWNELSYSLQTIFYYEVDYFTKKLSEFKIQDELTENSFHTIKVIVITAAIIYTNPTTIAIMLAGNSFRFLS